MKRTARCSCGQLSITVEGRPTGVGICHCFQCQRRTGSVFAALASFAGPVAVMGDMSRHTRSGDAGARFTFSFCPVCGTNLFHSEEGVEAGVAVSVGCFEEVGFPAPQVSIYDLRRHSWVTLPNGTKPFERDPD